MAPPSLWDDPEFQTTCFVVIDFEGTTSPGRRPEPIEVAALALRLQNGRLEETARFTALIAPPPQAPLTRFAAEQTGITADMLTGRPDAATVLAALDARLDRPPYILVAHHAPTEAGILFDYRTACPRLAATDFLDTVRLAQVAYPALPSHRLDALIGHLDIPMPAARHRARPDVEATAETFRRVIDRGSTTGRWRALGQLRADGGYPAKGKRREQEALF